MVRAVEFYKGVSILLFALTHYGS